MEKFFRINFIVVISCLLLKILHVPGSSILMMITTIILVVLGVIIAIKNFKSNPHIALQSLALSCWSIFIFFRFYFLYFFLRILGVSIIYWIPFLLTGAFLAVSFEKKIKLTSMGYVLIACFVVNTYLLIIPTSKVYYLLHHSQIDNQNMNEVDYLILDNYSVRLYNADANENYNKAMEYNQKAFDALKINLKSERTEEAIQDSINISNHKIQMENKVKSIKGD